MYLPILETLPEPRFIKIDPEHEKEVAKWMDEYSDEDEPIVEDPNELQKNT